MKIELLTPVHIGTGEEIPLYEWKVQDNCWLRFDWFTLPDRLLPPDDVLQDVDKLTKAAKDLSWEEGFKNKMYTAALASGISLPTKANDLFRECIKNQATFQPIIPGSSLKGAILTAYLCSGYESEGRFDPQSFGGKKLHDDARKELEGLMKGVNPASDFSHRLKISDIAFPQSALRIELAERRIKDRSRQPPGERLLKTWVECMAAGTVASATISFGSERDFAHEVAPQTRPLRKKDIEQLVKRCNHFAKAVIQAELDYYRYVGRKYRVALPGHYKKYGVDFVDKLPAMECLVRLGWSSGKNAMSIVLLNSNPDLARQPRPNPPHYRPKSRWLLSGNTPPGWCTLTFEPGDWIE